MENRGGSGVGPDRPTTAAGSSVDVDVALDRIVLTLLGASSCSESDPYGGAVPVVLLDGRSGSGKSTIATRVLERMALKRMPPVTLLRLDDVYPGWDGLRSASDQLVTGVLEPFRRGEPGRRRRWNWETGTPGPGETVDARLPLLIEGVGALSAAARSLATLGVWVELDARTRHGRAMQRDGDTYAPHWERWAAQEEEYLAREHPSRSADLVIDGRHILGP